LRLGARHPNLLAETQVAQNTFRTDGTIDAFDNQFPGRDYLIEFVAPEFTSVCPMTGQPDFGTIRVSYVPDRKCIELRSFKFYLHAFRSRGIFYEDVVNTILDDIVAAVEPRSATVTGEFNTRGGISARVTASYPSRPAGK
jgi:7-cyano-7-deazaguanine reductase